MQNGDIATWTSTRIIVVLEGMLASPKVSRVRKKLSPPDEWEWENLTLKKIVDYVVRLNVSIEIVTFISQDVADAAADFLTKYDVPVSSVDYADFDWFCRSLTWRPEVEHVVDSDPDRYVRYGQKGLAAQRGAEF